MTKIDDHGQPQPAINAERRVQRDIAEMLGFAKGVIADGVVNEDEAFALMNWADAHEDLVVGWPGNVLYRRLRRIFGDGHASDAEREDLRDLLQELVGGHGGAIGGETATTELPLNDLMAAVEIPNRTFAFTGRFAYGTRGTCEEAVRKVGGWVDPNITKHTDYLIIGTFASRDWLQTSYGRKILEAVRYRRKYSVPAIVSERHWVASL